MQKKNLRQIGTKKEEEALRYLSEQGVEIVEKNFYSGGGELDIIGKDGNTLVFFEIKYRSTNDFGSAAMAVDVRKCKKMVKAARYYMLTHGIREDATECRFDVVAMDGGRTEWIKNAFSVDML